MESSCSFLWGAFCFILASNCYSCLEFTMGSLDLQETTQNLVSQFIGLLYILAVVKVSSFESMPCVQCYKVQAISFWPDDDIRRIASMSQRLSKMSRFHGIPAEDLPSHCPNWWTGWNFELTVVFCRRSGVTKIIRKHPLLMVSQRMLPPVSLPNVMAVWPVVD